MTNKTTQGGNVAISQPECTEIGQRLRFLRKSVLGASRRKMAEWIGIPTGTLKHYETGSRKVSTELLTAISECCLTHSYFDWLFHGGVFRAVQIDPVNGVHNLQLLAKISEALPASGPAVLPPELVAELRTAIQAGGAA